MDPIVRWAGSKRQLAPRIGNLYSSRHSRYIEPFAGSACIFFHLQPETAILGDLNSELIDTLRTLRRDPYLVLECLKRYPISETSYYKVRKLDPLDLSAPERAARFLYLNRHCFNGLYRTNQQGKFNVPWGAGKKRTKIDSENIIQAADLLKRAKLVNGDFEETLGEVKRKDFVYLDPPYVVSTRRIFSEYLPGTFSEPDLIRLSKLLDAISKRGADFVLSYAGSPEASELASNWYSKQIQVRRHIAGFAGDRRHACELLISNFEIKDWK